MTRNESKTTSDSTFSANFYDPNTEFIIKVRKLYFWYHQNITLCQLIIYRLIVIRCRTDIKNTVIRTTTTITRLSFNMETRGDKRGSSMQTFLFSSLLLFLRIFNKYYVPIRCFVGTGFEVKLKRKRYKINKRNSLYVYVTILHAI